LFGIPFGLPAFGGGGFPFSNFMVVFLRFFSGAQVWFCRVLSNPRRQAGRHCVIVQEAAGPWEALGQQSLGQLVDRGLVDDAQV
jgi:hypothetical protein